MRFAGMIASAFAAACMLGSAAAQDKVVNIYNWNDYIDPAVLADFTKETGIKVIYDLYDNNEIVETKLLAGKSGNDIVVPSGPFLQKLIQAGAFRKLDKSKLANLGNAWPEIARRLAVYDPGNEYAVNYLWGTVGIGVNVAKVKERLGGEIPASWDLVFKPAVAAKLKSCGIYFLDAPEDVFPGAIRYLGLDPAAKKADDIVKAADMLMRVRGNVRKFHSSEYINALAGGDICLALGYSGDILQAKKRAEEAGNGHGIAYIIPKEGAQMGFDSMAIPADAPNADNAHIFINYVLRPDVAAKITNFVAYANGNSASRPLIKPEILGNPGVYPDDATFSRLFTTTPYDDRTQRTVTRFWTRVKTGK